MEAWLTERAIAVILQELGDDAVKVSAPNCLAVQIHPQEIRHSLLRRIQAMEREELEARRAAEQAALKRDAPTGAAQP